MNDELTNPDLLELEASLRGFSAASNVNRDELLFEAGRRSAKDRLDSRNGIWKCVSTVLALMLLGQSFLSWSSDDRQIADDGGSRDRPAVRESLPEIESPVNTIDSLPSPTIALQTNHSSQRSELLELRRIALARGIDAAFSHDAEDADHSAVRPPSQQELLRELLGS